VQVDRIFRLIGVCLLCCWSVPGQSAPDRSSPIAAALAAGQFDKALGLLEPALQESPRNPKLWTLQGLALSGKGRTKDALLAYQKALEISKDFLPALEGAAQIQYNAGSQEAVPLLNRVLRLRPEDPTSHAMLGVLAYKRADCPQAVQHFAQSGSLLQSQLPALQEYGACLLNLGQTTKAIEVFQQLLAHDPDDPKIRRALAAVQLASDQPQDAKATLEPLLASGNQDVKTLELASAVEEANKNTPKAVQLLRQAIVVDPHNTDLYVQFSDLCFVHQSFQTGIDMLNVGLRLQPDSAQLYLARGVLYVQIANYESAEADFEKAEQLDPQQSISAAALGLVAEETKQDNPDQALAIVREKLRRRPNDPLLWELQASILAEKAPPPGSPEFRQAVESARKAAALRPSLSSPHDVLGKLYLQAGQTELAIQECRTALRQNPNNQVALYHLIVALRKTGQKSELPDLLRRLAQARQEATREEAEHNRYKLVIAPESQGSANAQP
jgi:tetratricopeptide (TPR) repeat protein